MDTISEPAKPLPELVQQSELDTEIYFEGRTAFTKHLKGNNTWQLWKREQKIGEGSFSKVLLETCVETEEGKTAEPRPLRAVKVMKLKLDPKNPQQPNDLVISTYARELEILTKFSDPLYTELFVESYGWFRGENQICVALEYLPLGDLWRYFFESSPGKPPKRKKLPKDEVRNIMSQLLRALQTMHGNGFTHRDIKPENILVRRHPDWWVVLSDFGLSKRVESIRTGSSGMLGTMPFIAPEVYGSTEGMDWMPTDIYSLSELAVQMMTGRRTFDHPKAQSEYAAGKEDLFPSQRLYEHGADRTAVDFIQRLMAPIPHERLTAQAALEHAWITQNTDIKTKSIKAAQQTSKAPESSQRNVETSKQKGKERQSRVKDQPSRIKDQQAQTGGATKHSRRKGKHNNYYYGTQETAQEVPGNGYTYGEWNTEYLGYLEAANEAMSPGRDATRHQQDYYQTTTADEARPISQAQLGDVPNYSNVYPEFPRIPVRRLRPENGYKHGSYEDDTIASVNNTLTFNTDAEVYYLDPTKSSQGSGLGSEDDELPSTWKDHNTRRKQDGRMSSKYGSSSKRSPSPSNYGIQGNDQDSSNYINKGRLGGRGKFSSGYVENGQVISPIHSSYDPRLYQEEYGEQVTLHIQYDEDRTLIPSHFPGAYLYRGSDQHDHSPQRNSQPSVEAARGTVSQYPDPRVDYDPRVDFCGNGEGYFTAEPGTEKDGSSSTARPSKKKGKTVTRNHPAHSHRSGVEEDEDGQGYHSDAGLDLVVREPYSSYNDERDPYGYFGQDRSTYPGMEDGEEEKDHSPYGGSHQIKEQRRSRKGRRRDLEKEKSYYR